MKRRVIEIIDLEKKDESFSSSPKVEKSPQPYKSPFNILAEYRKRDGIDDQLVEIQREQQRQNKMIQMQEELRRQREEQEKKKKFLELYARTHYLSHPPPPSAPLMNVPFRHQRYENTTSTSFKSRSNLMDKIRKKLRKKGSSIHSTYLQMNHNTEKRNRSFENEKNEFDLNYGEENKEQHFQQSSLGSVSGQLPVTRNDPREDRKTKILDLPNVTDEIQVFRNQVEEVKKKSRRLAPSLDDLHKTILQWNFTTLHTPNESSLKRVPQFFTSVDDYIDIFEPLLLEELRAQLEKAKDEEISPPRRMRIKDVARINDFHLITFQGQGAHTFFQNNELLLVSKEEITSETIGNVSHIFGIIPKHSKEEHRKDEIQVKFYFQDKQIYKELLVNTEWYLKKIEKLSTMHREYQALHSIEHLHPNLIHSILVPSFRPLKRGSLHPQLKTKLGRFFNSSQIEAIDVAISNDGFILIQGPPGTGKTTLIEGILSVLLSEIVSEMTENNTFKVSDHNKCGANVTEDVGESKKHILLVAPSNAAVDELVLRLYQHGLIFLTLKENVPPTSHCVPESESSKIFSNLNQTEPFFKFDAKLGMYRFFPQIVRLGQLSPFLQETNAKVQLEDLIENAKLQNKEQKKNKKVSHNVQVSDSEILSFINSISEKTAEDNSETQALEISILNKASIICTTLSSSGLEILTRLNHGFETVIIDEAAQSVELSCLIPLKYGCKRCIMIGDPQQLPATVMSQLALSLQYERSLFQRMKENNYPCVMLDIQYRMHPLIRQFPSEHFYEGRLKDGKNITEQTMRKEYHSHPIFRPFVFFDLKNTCETKSASTHSLKNVKEAKFCALLVKNFFQMFSSKLTPLDTIGVITPYRQQVNELQNQFQQVFSNQQQQQQHLLQSIEINTVDGFQGREKDIIIFSSVRAHQGKGIGFLADIRRMNVALTRAKFALWVVGNSQMLSQNSHWKQFIDFAKENNFFLNIEDIDHFWKIYNQQQAVQSPTTSRKNENITQNQELSTMERKQPNRNKRKFESSSSSSSSSLVLTTMGKQQKRAKRQKLVQERTVKFKRKTGEFTDLSLKEVRKVQILSEDNELESSNIICPEKKGNILRNQITNK